MSLMGLLRCLLLGLLQGLSGVSGEREGVC